MDRESLPDISREDLEIIPIVRAETIPGGWYTSPQIHEFEKEGIFSQTWQYIGHLGGLKSPGDHIVGEVADNPIIVVRGQDQELRAFYNVCRHRGGPLALEDGHANVLQCKYHGWTYLLDGSLRGTPKLDRTELFDRKEYGLIPVSVDTWEGLIFVNLTKDGSALLSLLKGIAERIIPISLAAKKFFHRVTYDVNCNWKVYVDNYLEGYHLPYVHPELFKLLDYQNYVTETFEYYSLQHSPFRQKDNPYGSEKDTAFYFFVWPNFMLNILPNRLQTNLVVPVAHNRCMVIFDYFYDDIASKKAKEMIREDMEYSDKVQREDIDICERVQKGLASRAYTRGRFSVEMEQGVYHFQKLLKQAYSKALLTAR